MGMLVSVIIVNYNVKYFIELCLNSVFKAAEGIAAEVIVVDNNSKDGSREMITGKYPTVIQINNNDNRGFSKANNQGVAIAKGRYILFLNPDTVMPEDFLRKTLAYMEEHPEAGSMGPRLIDGKGLYAPDGKKSFPTLSVAIFKTTGINKIFSKSPYFNKYYAVHIGERQTSEVEVLSGCCMLVRSSILDKIGGAFDEAFFMYAEDVDLSWRIKKAGFKNIYYPEVTLIHFKGESTRKATLSYVRIFNEALITFVKKNYTKSRAEMFVAFIKLGILLRAILGVFKRVLKVLRLPLFDALVMLATLFIMKEFWVTHIKNVTAIPWQFVYYTFPVYTALWVVSLFFNGAYDQPYRPIRIVRGMIIGTVVILAYYGLLQSSLRYSRALIILSGVSISVFLLALHEVGYRLGIVKFVPYDQLPKKAVIVGNPESYIETARALRKVHYAPELIGRVGISENKEFNELTTLPEMKPLLHAAGIGEVIFCVEDMSYSRILTQMQVCGPEYDYKMHLSESGSFVGSNSSHTAGDLYTADKRYNIARLHNQRNKRVLDIVTSLSLFFLSPFLIWGQKYRAGFYKNIIAVLSGSKSWVSYQAPIAQKLPKLKPGILPPYFLENDYEPPQDVIQMLNERYAAEYHAWADADFIQKNIRWLGRE